MKCLIYDCKRHDLKPSIENVFYKFKFSVSIERRNNLMVGTNKREKNLFDAFFVCPELFS